MGESEELDKLLKETSAGDDPHADNEELQAILAEIDSGIQEHSEMSDPNAKMSEEDIAALLASMNESDASAEQSDTQASGDENQAMSDEDIAALLASMNGEEAAEQESSNTEPVAMPETSDPNAKMSDEDIAALLASMNDEPVAEEVTAAESTFNESGDIEIKSEESEEVADDDLSALYALDEEEPVATAEQESFSGLDDLSSLLGGFGEETQEAAKESEQSLFEDDDSDIMDLLGQMSEDNDLKDIEGLFKADSEGIPLEESLGDIPELSEELEGSEKPKKKGFFGRLFGENKKNADGAQADSDIEDDDELIDEEEEKRRKEAKEAKEAKKLQKKEAAKAKKAANAEKKKKKDAAKAEKKRLKEEKKAKQPVVKSPPLPKVPVILIFVMAASICATVLLAVNLLPYTMYLGNAENAFVHQDYDSAWEEMLGMNIKEDDQKLQDQSRVIMRVKGKLNAYNNYMAMGLPSEALHALICGIENYETYKAEAKKLGVEREFESVYNEMVNALGSDFYLDPETVKSWEETLSPADYTKMVRQAAGQ